VLLWNFALEMLGSFCPEALSLFAGPLLPPGVLFASEEIVTLRPPKLTISGLWLNCRHVLCIVFNSGWGLDFTSFNSVDYQVCVVVRFMVWIFNDIYGTEVSWLELSFGG
jgi:hypothetical protein